MLGLCWRDVTKTRQATLLADQGAILANAPSPAARESAAGRTVKSFVFAGETMDRASILRWRKQVLDA